MLDVQAGYRSGGAEGPGTARQDTGLLAGVSLTPASRSYLASQTKRVSASGPSATDLWGFASGLRNDAPVAGWRLRHLPPGLEVPTPGRVVERAVCHRSQSRNRTRPGSALRPMQPNDRALGEGSAASTWGAGLSRHLAHLDGWATSHRPELREYLERVNA